jgi:hypothetical protein
MGKKIGKKTVDITEKWHPFIATPAYDGKVDVDYALSMTEAAFCAPLYSVQITASCVANGAFIDLARNQFVKKFLEDEECKDCTHLFFIDADLKFPANAFIGLARAGLPICAGVYRRRQETEDFPIKYTEHKDGGLWVDDDWIMADRVPTGFLCIRRDIVEEMAADAQKIKVQGEDGMTDVPRLFYTDILEDGRFIGEDFAFCEDYIKKYQRPIHVWPNIDFVHGGYHGNLSDFLERKIAAEDAA